jgi:hypothetical protein
MTSLQVMMSSQIIMGNDIIMEDHPPASQVQAFVTLVLPTAGN